MVIIRGELLPERKEREEREEIQNEMLFPANTLPSEDLIMKA